MLGKNPPPSTVSNGKSSNPIKVMKRDAQSLRIVSLDWLCIVACFSLASIAYALMRDTYLVDFHLCSCEPQKLAVGGLPEKIISAFQVVHEEIVNEEAAFDKCESAISGVKELRIDIESSFASGKMWNSFL